MTFYGLNNNFSKNTLTNLKRKRNLRLRKYGFGEVKSPLLNYKPFIFNIPQS